MEKTSRMMYRLLLAAALGVLSWSAGVQYLRGQQSDPAIETGFRVSVDVDLVMLDVAVEDDDGDFVRSLKPTHFSVFEDGVRQEISVFKEGEVPLSVGLVVDKSGSMRRKHKDVVTAGVAFAQAQGERDQLFVVNFNERPFFGLPSGQAFTRDAMELRLALLRTPIEGRTALYDALLAAIRHLRLGGHSKRALIVVSDGGDNISRSDLSQVVEAARRAGVILYGIGFRDSRSRQTNLSVLQTLARETGGAAFYPRSAGEARGITRAIADDLRRQYLIGYVPTSPRDGSYRQIEVRVNSPRHDQLQVRTKAGYYATPTFSSRQE